MALYVEAPLPTPPGHEIPITGSSTPIVPSNAISIGALPGAPTGPGHEIPITGASTPTVPTHEIPFAGNIAGWLFADGYWEDARWWRDASRWPDAS